MTHWRRTCGVITICSGSAVSCAICQIEEDDDNHEECDPADAHQACVGHRTRSLCFYSSHGGDCRDDDSEAKPDDPVHRCRVLQDARHSASCLAVDHEFDFHKLSLLWRGG